MRHKITRCLSEVQCRRDQRQRRYCCGKSLLLVRVPSVSALFWSHR